MATWLLSVVTVYLHTVFGLKQCTFNAKQPNRYIASRITENTVNTEYLYTYIPTYNKQIYSKYRKQL